MRMNRTGIIGGLTMVSVKVDTPVCNGCGQCIDICPAHVLSLVETDSREVVSVIAEDDCTACGACGVKCPEYAIKVTGYEMLKVDPSSDYPPEDGRYLRGNDYSPVAVAAILDTDDSKIPQELTELITTAVEAGAALAGTLQTENIGIEKVIANIVANPNIRYLVLCWREAQGHLPAEALHCLVENGVANDKRRTIIGATAPTPYLANITHQAIERFRKQVKIVSIIMDDNPPFGMQPENVRRVVQACIQEKPTEFEEYVLYDPGAWPEPAICEKLSMRITEPWRPELSAKESEILQRMKRAGEKQEGTSKDTQPKEKKNNKDGELLLELLGIKRKRDENDEEENPT